MVTPLPNSNMTVAEVLEKWPETFTVFQEFKTACVGCVMAPFDTIDDVARIYEMDLSDLIEALDAMVSADGQPEQ